MASTEGPARAHDRHGRRKPFASWMKRLANLKSSHFDSNQTISRRRSNVAVATKPKKGSILKNNPYPLSTRTDSHNANHPSFSTPFSLQRSRHSSLSQSKHSVSISHDSQMASKSRAPTLATTAETTFSDAAPSGAGTSGTAARTEGDRNSTFSSPAPSVRSMTTTLTTIHSAAPPMNAVTNTSAGQHAPPNNSPSNYSTQPATAVPAHLAPHAHLATYQSATANNMLTDDASILTLASSSKRRRKNSLDTNASVKALAPASMFGGSRESLPLSVLSGTIIHPGQGAGDNASLSGSVNPRSTLNAERASLISASGVTAPALASERNSYIGSKYGDGASVRSGLLGATGGGHGRNDSITGSIGGRELRDRDRERERERDRDREMIPPATSQMVDGPPTPYTTANTTPAEKTRSRQRSLDWAEHRLDAEAEEDEEEEHGAKI